MFHVTVCVRACVRSVIMWRVTTSVTGNLQMLHKETQTERGRQADDGRKVKAVEKLADEEEVEGKERLKDEEKLKERGWKMRRRLKEVKHVKFSHLNLQVVLHLAASCLSLSYKVPQKVPGCLSDTDDIITA